MPTILSHPAVPLAASLAFGRGIISGRLLAAGVIACILPDLDVIAFRFGIPYTHILGHRGFSHSIGFAVLLGLIAAWAAPRLDARRWVAFAFILAATFSHGLLDSITDGGEGIALLWPFTDARYFAPWQPLAVSPIGIRPFFSRYGATVLRAEIVWVWLPAFAIAISMAIGRRIGARSTRH